MTSTDGHCNECNGYRNGATNRRTFKVCQCPASRGNTTPVPESLEDQVRAILPAIPKNERVPFLAGMRFAQGHAEYGSGLFRITDEKLAYERDCEAADVYVMDAERWRRNAKA